jgi:peptide/nickel transport system ATP-binding protein/oligopeptide transport system ATP-binding protein
MDNTETGAGGLKEAVLLAGDITKYFPVRNAFGRVVNRVKAVDGVTLTLYRGETYGLVGETGCGKSTLGRSLIRLQNPTSGTVIFNKQDITALNENELQPFRRDMQMVFQDPYTSLNPRIRVGDMLLEALAIHKTGRNTYERIAIAMEIMDKVGLRTEHFYRYPHEFSGGQRQRIGLARALILNPKLIICDEPVSALDVSIQSQIINLLLDLQKQFSLTYLFIAHDISVVKYISDRVGVMYLGRLVETAPTEELFNHTLHPYTQALLSAVPEPDPRLRKKKIALQGDPPSPLNPPPGCVFHPRCPKAMPFCSRLNPVLKAERDGYPEHTVACHLYNMDDPYLKWAMSEWTINEKEEKEEAVYET